MYLKKASKNNESLEHEKARIYCRLYFIKKGSNNKYFYPLTWDRTVDDKRQRVNAIVEKMKKRRDEKIRKDSTNLSNQKALRDSKILMDEFLKSCHESFCIQSDNQ